MQSWYANSDIRGDPGLQNKHLQKLMTIAKDFEKECGTKIVCSLAFDEMNIRKQIIWSLQHLNFPGFIKAGDNSNDELQSNVERKIAKQAIVFLLTGLNASFEYPIAYYFIDSLKQQQRRDLLHDVVTFDGYANVTFDGYASNIGMCELFGAVLDVSSPNYKTFLHNFGSLPHGKAGPKYFS